MAGARDAAVQRIVRIDRFDAVTAGKAQAMAYPALIAKARRCVVPVGLSLPPAYVLNRLRNMSPDHRVHIWVAYDGDAMVGAVEVSWVEAPDNRDRAWVHLDVLPPYVDVAAGGLVEVASSFSAGEGRTVLTVEVEAESALSAWVRARGGRLGSLDQHNVVRLASLRRDDVAALAAAAPAGYEAVVVDGAVPDDLLAPYAKLVETMNAAPHDDLTIEDAVFTPERVRRWEAGIAARGHGLSTVIARSTASGDLAGFNQLVLRTEWPEVVENADTAVAVAHRGHGIGLWIKAVNLLRVIDDHPGAVCVETWNAASNEHMLRVNRRLGFVTEHVVEAWELSPAPVAV